MIFDLIGVICMVLVIGFIANTIMDIRKKSRQDRMSFKESMDLTELPVVTFYNGSNKLNFLLDTGSNMCVINSKVIDSLNYKKLDEEGSIIGMEGNPVDIYYISMDFTYNNKSYSSTFQVVDMQEAFDRIKQESGVSVHGILGSKFFEEYKYVLDFKDLIAYSNI